jgi:hypothetical protein
MIACRVKELFMIQLKTETYSFDVVVIGGGIAGISTAISAARQGAKTALLDSQNGLGGNASSQIRVCINGASYYNYFPNAREGGIVEEIRTAVAEIDPVRSYKQASIAYWSLCEKQDNLELFTDFNVDSIETDGKRLVQVAGNQTFTERRIVFEADQFVDATGDGTLAMLAGCEFMIGREAKETFDESLAPEQADMGIMGSTLIFRGAPREYPVEFVRPEWAYHFEKEDDLPFRLGMYQGAIADGFWWMEWAGPDDDSIGQHHVVQQELWRYAYGIWDFLKRDPNRGMENYDLDVVGLVPGKRESRRFVGDYVMTEQDIISARIFDDAVAYGGWNIDLHAPSGIKSPEPPNVHVMFPWLYTIPLRSLYTKDMDNLWLAGRDMSVSHVALGAVRLQGTLGLCGEAIGVAAALAQKENLSCREVATKHIRTIQQEVLKDGVLLPGFKNRDENDLALRATISASSSQVLIVPPSEEFIALAKGKAVSFPVTEQRLDAVRFVLKNNESAPVSVALRLTACKHPNDFLSKENLAEIIVEVAPGRQVVEWDVGLADLDLGLYALFVESPHDLEWQLAEETPLGVYSAEYNPDKYANSLVQSSDDKPFAFANMVFLSADHSACDWQRMYCHRDTLPNCPPRLKDIRCGWFETVPVQRPYEPSNVINGIPQTEHLPNLWLSEPSDLSQDLTLEWDTPQSIQELHLVLDTDMNMDQPRYYSPETLIADLTVLAEVDGAWQEIAVVSGNRKRKLVLSVESVTTRRIRLECRRIHREGLCARIFEVRCYG